MAPRLVSCRVEKATGNADPTGAAPDMSSRLAPVPGRAPCVSALAASRTRYLAAALTLVLSLVLAGAAPVGAETESVTGTNGPTGADGASGAPGLPGGPGGDGESVSATANAVGEDNTATARGGNGGFGGRGGDALAGSGTDGGTGGNGGDGGAAIADVSARLDSCERRLRALERQ